MNLLIQISLRYLALSRVLCRRMSMMRSAKLAMYMSLLTGMTWRMRIAVRAY